MDGMKLTNEQQLRLRVSQLEAQLIDSQREVLNLRMQALARRAKEREEAERIMFSEFGLKPPFQIAADGTVLGADGRPLP